MSTLVASVSLVPCWVLDYGSSPPLRDSVAKQLRMCPTVLSSAPRAASRSPLQLLFKGSRRFPREGPLDLCFLVSLDLPWEQLQFQLLLEPSLLA